MTEDGRIYKDILDALPVGVAFAVPVQSTKHRKDGRRAKDFRFVYVNERMEALARADGADGEDLLIQPGDMLGLLARSSRKKKKNTTNGPRLPEDDSLASEDNEDETQVGGAKVKTITKSRGGLLGRLLKAHKHAWRTGAEVEVAPSSRSCAEGTRTQHLVKLIKRDDEIVGVLTLTQHSAKGRDTQEERKKQAAAKELDMRRSRFIADMSHEIRTPMNGIIGMVSLLADDDQLTTLQREFVDTMYASAQHLLMLINDVLDYSKMSLADEEGSSSPKLKITSAPLNLCAVVHDCVSSYASQARDVGVDIIIHIAPGIVKHPFYCGDPLRLRQVLANLVSNAVKFTKEGFVLIDVDYGRVRRRSTVDYASLSDADNQREIVFRVIDTGLGVKREDMEKIFLPYVQEESRETESFGGGTGLGLSIARQIATIMGGTLELESSHRRGRRRSVDTASTLQRGISTIRSSLKLTSSDDNVPSYHSHFLYPCPSPLYEPFTRVSGSTFTLRLPMKMDPSASPSSSTSSSSSSATTQHSSVLGFSMGGGMHNVPLPSLRMSDDATSPAVPMRVLLVGLPPVLAVTIDDLLSFFGAKCKIVSEEEAKRILSRPTVLVPGKSKAKAHRWDVVAIFKGQGEGYMDLAKRIRKEEKVQAREKIKLLLLAYTPDQVDTKSLEENGWDAYFALPVQPVVMLQMMARLRDEINRKAEKKVSRRILQKNEQDDLERARKEWHQKNKQGSDSPSPSPKRERSTGIRFLRRGRNSNSDNSADNLPPRERLVLLESKEERRREKSSSKDSNGRRVSVSSSSTKSKSKLITKYSFVSTKPKVAADNQWSGLNALVVDDNAINRKVAVRMLESVGFRRSKISHAHDGEEALEKARDKEFDVILMDCFMPRMNGWEASQRLRADGLKGIIIATTGVASSAEVAKCHSAGMDACMQKPLVLDQFRDTLNSALRARYASSPPPQPASSLSSSSAGLSSSGGSSVEYCSPCPDPSSIPPLPMSASAPSALNIPQSLKERNRSF